MKSKCSFFEIIVAARDFWTCFMEKMRFQQKPHLFLFFIVAQFHVKLAKKWWIFFYDILASKMKLADGFMIFNGIKLWNRQIRLGKKMKLTARKKWNWRHAASPRPSVSFFSAVSFIFFPTESGRFHNFSR